MRQTILVAFASAASLCLTECSADRRSGEEPDFAPSYTVHISPAQPWEEPSTTMSPKLWMARGFNLKSIILTVYEVEEGRIDFSRQIDSSKGFDFILVPPKPLEEKAIHRLVQKAIEPYFRLKITYESRRSDVYVMNAPNGRSPLLKDVPDPASNVTGSGLGMTNTAISGQSLTMRELSESLAQTLHRPVVDETHLAGHYTFKVQHKGAGGGDNVLLKMLRQDLGLNLTRDHRNIDILVVRPT